MAMVRWLITAAALVVAGATAAENLTSTRTELAPTGKLRVGLLVGSLGPSTFYTARDPTTGQLRGVSIDLAGALARELRVPLDLVPYSSAEALNQSATAGAWDVTFMTVDHHRQTLVDFGPAYAVFEATYLVPSASPIRSITDVDQPGIRVSAIRGGGLALRLSQSLRMYRPRFVRHRIACYAARAADESWLWRMAAGVWNPCRSMSQVVLELSGKTSSA